MIMRALILLALLCLAACSGTDESDSEIQPGTDENVEAAEVIDNNQVQNRGADKDNWWDSLPRPEWSAYERVDLDDDWFEVYRIDDGIFAIYEPGHFEEVISFLITGSDRALLFDTGLGIGNIKTVVDLLTNLDVIVLNSHTHFDHIGGNHLFDVIYGTNLDYTNRRAKGLAHESVAEFVQDGWIWKDLPEGFSRETYQSLPFRITSRVNEGDVIDIGGRKLEILFTPGHAPDSICLIDRENRLLFTGDSFYLAPLYTHIEGSSFSDYAKTARRLAGLADEIDSAVTSHNVPVVDGSYMTALGQAFADIQSGAATNVTVSDGIREYHFDGFSVMVKE